ncbi:hypothetical protein, partial [Timonella senegalensis]|uniref:hypothetical protein n=1 Tax=Timonella senegalensis TaxID=1465825 RepID=UPI00058C1BD3
MTDGAGSIRDLQSATLLGTTRLAKLFGVSRYTIRMWAAGYEMNARSKERLRRVQEAVSALQLDSPEEVQRALLDGSAGKSLYRELLDELTGAPVHQSALTVLDLLGVGREGHDMSAPRE